MGDIENRVFAEVDEIVRISAALSRDASASGSSLGANRIEECASVVTRIGRVIDLLFGPKSYYRTALDRITVDPHLTVMHSNRHNGISELAGLAKAIQEEVKTTKLWKVIEGVRAESTTDLLDQAQTLVATKHLAAATVVAGGALEMYLHHYCLKHEVACPDSGSISKYDGAVAQARKGGQENLYSPSDSKMVLAWAGYRNDAAHSPGTFTATAADVGRMIEGITEFLARTG